MGYQFMWFRTKKMRDAAAAAAADRVRTATAAPTKATNFWEQSSKPNHTSYPDTHQTSAHSQQKRDDSDRSDAEYEGSLASAIAAFVAASARRRLPAFLFRDKSGNGQMTKRASRMLVGHSCFIRHQQKRECHNVFDRSHAQHFAFSESLTLTPLFALTAVHYVSSYCRYPSRSEEVLPVLLTQVRENIAWQGICFNYIQHEPFSVEDKTNGVGDGHQLTPCQRREMEADFRIRAWWSACVLRSGLLMAQLLTFPLWLCLAVFMPHFVHAVLAHSCFLLRDKYAALPAPPPTPVVCLHSQGFSATVNSNSKTTTPDVPRTPLGTFGTGNNGKVPRVVAHPRRLNSCQTRSAAPGVQEKTAWKEDGSTFNSIPNASSDNPLKLVEQIHKRIQACDDGAHIHARFAALPTDVVAAAVLLNVLFTLLFFL